MNLLSVEKVTKSYGAKILFNEVTFGIDEGEKIGLIGINGTGKSTLLKLLAGQESPDRGQITRANNLRVGYLPQNPVLRDDGTILEEVIRGHFPLVELIRDYEGCLRNAESNPDDRELHQKLVRLSQRMDEMNAWQLESQAKTVLTQLGITEFQTKVGLLSGGQRKRVALAAALINPADLLLLDEPTNHIDNQTVDWLEQFLRQRPGALLMITHDRYFLDRVAGKIVELSQGSLYSYSGNYSLFLEKKAQRQEEEEASAAKRENLYRRELAWMKRGAKARTTKQQARIGRFEKLQTEMDNAEDSGQIEIAAGSSRLGKKIIVAENLAKSFDGQPIISGFNYTFLRNDRVGVIGPNGIGKTTLLNIIAGNIASDHGKVDVGPTVKLGFFAQEYPAMDENMRVIEYIKEQAELMTTADGGVLSASQMLERFLFPAGAQWTPIAKLSGGERRRLYLLRILMSAPNVLLLDEPTNDLDVQTLSIFEDYLDDFSGVVIAVSHDRYFLDRVIGKMLIFEGNGHIRHFVGNYSEFLEFQKEFPESSARKNGMEPMTNRDEKGKDGPKRERPVKLSYLEQRELDTIDSVIARTEHELAEVKIKILQMGSDYLALQELTNTQEDLGRQLDELLERWAYLNEKAEEAAQSKLN